MNRPQSWPHILILVGSIAMVVGAIDPLEGSVLILPGSALVALGTFLDHSERRVLVYRLWAFVLIAVGVGAMWYISSQGGFGGDSGHSEWWGILALPYVVGWSMVVWGPGSPRWLCWLGVAVGVYFLVLFLLIG